MQVTSSIPMLIIIDIVSTVVNIQDYVRSELQCDCSIRIKAGVRQPALQRRYRIRTT